MIEMRIDITDNDKAREFLNWARTNKIQWTDPGIGYIINVKFNNIFEVLRWL
jgi:hypothetical protein